jgi:hypothetical protein
MDLFSQVLGLSPACSSSASSASSTPAISRNTATRVGTERLAGVADRARRAFEARHDARHGDIPTLLRHHALHHAAREIVRIADHLRAV